jgi:hypothetical protein
MRRLLRYLEWTGRYGWFQISRHWRYSSDKVILARHACLGAGVIKILQPAHKVVNIQKGRVDYLVDCWQDSRYRARTLSILPHMPRDAIISCIMQEELLYDWMQPKQPLALFMDSGAEYFDQLFIDRNKGWRFLSSYTDLNHTERFKRSFSVDGLLPLEDLHTKLKTFLEIFRSRFGDIPIYYLHFPVKFEVRKKFQDRYVALRDAVDGLASEYQLLYSLAVNDGIVTRDENCSPEMSDFPYHYNKGTYEAFADMIRATGTWPC